MTNIAVLEVEVLTYASVFHKLLGESNDWFLISRFGSTPKRREYALRMWEEKDKQAELILEEAKEFMPLIKEIVCCKI